MIASRVRSKHATYCQADFDRNVILIRLSEVAPRRCDVTMKSLDAARDFFDERWNSRSLVHRDHDPQQIGDDVAHGCVIGEAIRMPQDPARASFLFQYEVFAHESKDAFHRSEQTLGFGGVMTARSQTLYQRPLPGNARFRLRDMAAGALERCFGRDHHG